MHTVHDVCVPTVVAMNEGMRDGAKIEVHGDLDGHHDRFTVELVSGPHIVLHIDFRLGYSGDHTVVMNTCRHGSWGEEVRAHNPLHHSDHFHLVIKAHHHHFDIHVNGHHLADFHHRLPMESIQGIGFSGHAHVHKVHFEGFHFHNAWGNFDNNLFGHSGWVGYGTDSYTAPSFFEGHSHMSYY